MEAELKNNNGFTFRRFSLFPRQRRLLLGDAPIELGSRAFDLLLALVETPGKVVGRDVLIGRVWERRTVTDNNLQVQIAALRNALGADRDLIRTVAGRGYQFTGEVLSTSVGSHSQPSASAVAPPSDGVRANLPEAVSELIGRDVELGEILALVAAHRLVTLTGAGGIGKTRLALETARQLLPKFPDGIWVVEMSSLSDPGFVPAAVATAVGIEPIVANDTVERVGAALASRELLIVLDTCEHVIEAAAEMAEALLRAGAGVRVIATSREPLGAYGEWLYRVLPLPVPLADSADTEAEEALSVSLFIARAQATDADFLTEEPAAAAIAAICRGLDGIPLAIELAAASAARLGLYTLADRLDDRLQLLTCGRRTALPRHQTLRATLDWSYGLLPRPEQALLRRLAVFRGGFGLDEARAVATDVDLTPAEATEALANLAAKSLVSTEIVSGKISYRLLETTRCYAFEKLAVSGEYDAAVQRHSDGAAAPFDHAPRRTIVATAGWRYAA
jgi:predicted ATPase/DNA-binding winged helix-turn-helix (wHTH) protein